MGEQATTCQAARNMMSHAPWRCLTACKQLPVQGVAAHSVAGLTEGCLGKQRLLFQQVKSCCPVLRGLCDQQLFAWQHLHHYDHQHCH